MNELLISLTESKKLLVNHEFYDEAKIVKQMIDKISNKTDDSINITNNEGQLNIASGNGSINATQNKKY